MEQKDKLKIFIRFLKKHKAYNQFFANCFSDNGNEARNVQNFKSVFDFINSELNNQGDIIVRAFGWNETKEGRQYWLDLYHEWEKIRINLN